MSGTRTRYGRLSRPTKDDASLLDESQSGAQASLDALSEDEGQPGTMSAEEDSDYEPEAVQPKTPPSRRNIRRGRQTPKARTPGDSGRSNGGDHDDLFEEEAQMKRDIYDFDAQSIISEDQQRTTKRRGRPPGARRSETSAGPSTPAQETPSKASWGSNIYSSIATALKNRSDLDVYTSFLKSSIRNDELDSLYTEVCKPCTSHSTLFYGPSAALQSMMSRINNHDKIIDVLRQLMARNLDGLVNRTAHLVPIVQQPLLSTEYLASLTRSSSDPKLTIDCGYVLEQEVNMLSGKFDLGYMSGGIPTIVTSDRFYQKLISSIQSGEADDNRVLLALTDDNQLVAIALVRPDEADSVPYKLKKPIFGDSADADNETSATEPKPPVVQSANGGVCSEQETALLQMADWVQKEATENFVFKELVGDSCAKLRLLDAVLLKPNGKRDVLLMFSGRKPDGHIFALIDEHRFIYQRFGFSKDVPIGLDAMMSAYPEDLLSEKSLLVVPDSLFKAFKKLLTKNANSAPASVSAKFVLLDKYKKTPLSVVITCGTTLRLKADASGDGFDEPWTLVCVNGLVYALRIDNRFVSKAMELLPVRQFLKAQGSAQPTLCNFWDIENRRVTVEVDCSGESSTSAQSLSTQTYPCALYEKFMAMDRQRILGRFVDDFLQRVLSAPVEISLYDQVFRMAQANTPEVVEVPSSSGAPADGQQAQMDQWGVCSICAKELKAQSSLFDHEMRHLGCNKFSCGEHDFIFHDRKSYRAHMEEFHAGQKLDEDSDFEEDDLERLRQIIDPHQCTSCHDYFPYAQVFNWHTEHCDGASFQSRTPLNRGLTSQRNNPCVAVCGLCGYSLSSRDRLKRHFISMHMQCAVCQATADTLEAMSEHYKSHAATGGRKIITCDICGEFHGTKHNFYFHQWTNHGLVQPQAKADLETSAEKQRRRRSKVVIAKDELSYQATGSKKFSCKFCSTDVRITGQEYVKHLNSKHGLLVDSNNVCRCCGELCENPEKLSEHLKDVHVPGGEYVNAGIQTIFQCDACPFWGFLKGVIDHSKNVHKDTNPAVYQCHHCQERFSDRKLWRSHLDKHNYSLTHQCDYCDKAFRMRTSLLQHVRNHHMQEDEPVSCEYCGQQYPKQSALKAHIFRMHSAEGQEMKFHCEVCQRRFRLEPELRRHMKEMHSGQIECDICGKECPNLRCYTQHRQKHFRTKIFQCTDCQATFKSKMAMKRHIRVEHLNLGPERYECQICGKVVTQIAMHMLTHKEARYECEICGKKFTKSTYYNEHVRIHKGEKPFMCQLCGRRFNKKSNLNVHVRFHEKNRDKDGNYLELKNQNRGTYPAVNQSSTVPKADAVTDTSEDSDARAILGIEAGVACDTVDLDSIVGADDTDAAAAAAGLKVIAGRAEQWTAAEEPEFKRPKLEPRAAAAQE